MQWLTDFLFGISFNIFGITFDLNNLAATVTNLCNWNTISSTTLWSLAQSLHSVIVPFGLSLLTLFAMLDLLKKAMEVERLTWERVAMAIVRFLIFKMLIENSFRLLTAIMAISNDILTRALSALGSLGSSPSLSEMVAGLFDGLGIIDTVIMVALLLLLYLPLIGTVVGVIVQVFVRIAKLILHFAYAPIPLAVGTWEDGVGVGKRFIMSTAALGVEALLIVACVQIYSMGMSQISNANAVSTMVAIMLLNGFLMFMISLTNQLAEKWTGGS